MEHQFDGREHRIDDMERHFDGREHRVDDMERRFDGREHRSDDMERHFDGREHRMHHYYAPLSIKQQKRHLELGSKLLFICDFNVSHQNK